MNSKNEDDQKRIIELLNEIAKWVRFEGVQRARQVLVETLKKDSEKLAYHYSDGRGSAEVAKLVGVSDFTVRNYWKKWATLGLVIPSEKFKGRYERTLSLEDLGIEVSLKSAVGTQELEEAAGETTK